MADFFMRTLTTGRLRQRQQEKHARPYEGSSGEIARLCRRAAADGCVLLENDGTLPLDPEREVAVFGRCQLDWFSMGNGSGGDVSAPYLTNLMDGIRDIGARHNRLLAEIYRRWAEDEDHAATRGIWGRWPQSLEEMPVGSELAQAAAETSQVAVVVLGRNAGEDQDLTLDEGGYFLTAEERQMLACVRDAFEHIVLVVNAANMVDLSWAAGPDSGISAVLLCNQGGQEAGCAAADVLYGRVCPSGRLTSTVARSWEDHPSSRTFGRTRRIDYAEGIFCGYRHFDAHAADRVLYPFGHGLSYTSFCVLPFALERQGAELVSRAFVENTGRTKGACTLLLWCAIPEGALEKPVRVLVGFAKTPPLLPSETKEVAVSFDLRALASFDERSRAFVIEEGSYELTLEDAAAGSIDVAHTLIIERCEHLCTTTEELRTRILERLPLPLVAPAVRDVDFSEVAAGHVSLESFVVGMSDEDLSDLVAGEGRMDSAFGPRGNAGAFGGVTERLRGRGIPAAVCADGPSGARLLGPHTLLPSATTLASTFDCELVARLYRLVGQELSEEGVDCLLAPAMNIQRNPLCGRNFEYFSEDPLLTGLMGSAVVRGLREAGVAACPKHLAANNQERSRSRQDSRIGERALREIYLRGFEICVRREHPDLVMCAYNRLNGAYCHCNYDLMTTIVRQEWGFTGVAITDWWARRPRSPEFPELGEGAYRVRAGVDVAMPGNVAHVPWRMRDTTTSGAERSELERCALRVLGFLARRMRQERGLS